MEIEIKEILKAYGLNSEVCNISLQVEGHIHDTFLVSRCSNEQPPLILQKLNQFVFSDIDLLMHNMEQVTAHIADRNRNAGLDPAKNGIILLETDDEESYIGTDDNGYWRMSWFIENQQSFENAKSPELAFEGGKCIAHFQDMLSDLDTEKIEDTLPQFHNLDSRLDQFRKSLETAQPAKLENARDLFASIENMSEQMLNMYRISEESRIPVRLTHNDTKFNNILFSNEGKATCLIDLDTVMKGYSWFDYGDALRTCAETAPEDEPDPSKIDFRMDIFMAFTRGYLETAKYFLTQDELKLLPGAPSLFAFMQGVRFLSDYLNNDEYYKIFYPEHNLVRAKAQFTLMNRMLEKQKEIEKIVHQAC